ncbi:MAG: hypothetical protein KME55_25175 [Nostoc indistinguendum CM1-VF10]|nr:hypothetical protein [Nostoc indistinguendum CM1-VF10]
MLNKYDSLATSTKMVLGESQQPKERKRRVLDCPLCKLRHVHWTLL